MTKHMFKCKLCKTLLTIETELPDDQIHRVPPCPCGKSRMISLNSPEYAYNKWD